MDSQQTKVPNASILIVDDIPLNLKLLATTLGEYGHQVRTVNNGVMALEAVQMALPDLILLDIRMPEMDGYEVCRRLKANKRTRDIPIIFVSALDTAEDKVKGLAVGGVDYISKPIQPQEVLTRVTIHLTLRNAQKELEEKNAQLGRVNDELVAMYDVMTIASQSLDLDTMLARTLSRVLEAVKSDKGAIHLLDQNARMLHIVAQQGLDPDMQSQIASLPAEGLGKWDERHSEAILVPGTASNRRVAVHPSRLQRYVSIPMRAGGRALGLLGILRETTQSKFSQQEMVLLTSLADHVGAVVESARLRHLAEQAAVLQERQRLARDLHDSVTQSLYSLTLLTEGGRRMAESGNLENAQDYFVDLGEIALQSLKEIRLLVHELRPPVLEQEGLVGALQQRLDAVEGRAGVNGRLLVEGEIELAAWVEKELYNIAREALNNALKHATATALTVRFRANDTRIEIEIEDNGCGFDPKNAGDAGGMGLSTMKERAERLGSTLTILSMPGEGTKISASVARPVPDIHHKPVT
jgi:signal transduction histidine kinase